MENKLTDGLLEQLATLSKLELADSDQTELRRELAQMLTYVDKLSNLNTEDSLPLTHFPNCTRQPDTDHSLSSASAQPVSELRADIPCPEAHPEQFVALAPNQKDSCYIVPNPLQRNE